MNANARILRVFAGPALVAAAAIVTAVSVPAQSGPGNFPGHWGGGPGGFRHAGFGKVVTGEPYTATAVSTMDQTLSDGTHITRQTTASIARDSEGRTMRSQTFGQNGATVVSIFDPVANQRIEYNTGTKKARIFTLPARTGSSDATAETSFAGMPRGNHFHSSNSSVASDSLGTQTIAGLSAQGSKTTRTIAAGAFGNDKPLVSTEETWYSPDLKILLQSTRNDPRFGQTTYTVSNLQRAEPSASLFQVPAGYESKTVDIPARRTAP